MAFAITLLADGIQMLLGPFGWVFPNQVIDVVTMLLISFTVGFHVLFLPTFVAEFFPGIGMLPTWTGCMALVIAQRWRQQQRTRQSPPPTHPSTPSSPNVIDV